MLKKPFLSKQNLWEVVFQLCLLVVVFIFYSSEHSRGNLVFRVEEHEVVFFLNYVCAVFLLNYWLLPRFLYQKKVVLFVFWLAALIAGVMLVEELIIEKIYFPDTRGAKFPSLFFNLLGILPVIIILSGFKFAWDAIKKQSELEKLQIAVKESELQYLKSQINPHFLFNNLNNLYSYALEKSPKTPGLILELSGLLRYMLYECKEEYVSLNREVGQLGNFINLSKLQLEERGVVKFEKDIYQGGFLIAPLILPVFVENAFKHSLSSMHDQISIEIDLKVNDQGFLVFTCRNSYSVQTNVNDLTKGIGLKNVRKRLDILYPDSYQLKIVDEEEMYAVELTLDLQ